jgi:hypothetical protein
MRSRSRLRAPWSSVVALTLFLGGTHYCLIGAFAGPGARVGCGMLATPLAAATGGAATPACHAAPARHAPAADGGAGSTPAPSPAKRTARGTLPCCIALAPVVSPEVVSLAAVGDGPVAVVPAAAIATEAPRARCADHARPPETGPPEPPAYLPLSARAPPRA